MKAIEVPVAAYLGVQLGLEILDCCRFFIMSPRGNPVLGESIGNMF